MAGFNNGQSNGNHFYPSQPPRIFYHNHPHHQQQHMEHNDYINFDQFISQHNFRPFFNENLHHSAGGYIETPHLRAPPPPLSTVFYNRLPLPPQQPASVMNFITPSNYPTNVNEMNHPQQSSNILANNSYFTNFASNSFGDQNYMPVGTSGADDVAAGGSGDNVGNVENYSTDFIISNDPLISSTDNTVGLPESEVCPEVEYFANAGDKLLAALSGTHIRDPVNEDYIPNITATTSSNYSTQSLPNTGRSKFSGKFQPYSTESSNQLKDSGSMVGRGSMFGRGSVRNHSKYHHHYSQDYRRGGSGRTASQYDGNYYQKYHNHFSGSSSSGVVGGSGEGKQIQQGKERSLSYGKFNSKKDELAVAKEGQQRLTHKNSNEFHISRSFDCNKFKGNRSSAIAAVIIDTDVQCSQREKLTNEIESDKLECLVCCEMIKPFHSIWSCMNCYHIIHFQCVVKWAASSKSDDGWRCPACQNITKKVPTDCYCFCGKQRDPPYNRTDVAHTCGDLCGRTDGCDHPCTLLCHPGPCPPCQATVIRRCGCGRSEKMMQCCQNEELQCTETCDKLLNCQRHNCEKKCHFDLCRDCEEMVEHKCYCGKDRKEVICNEENNASTRYSCGKICNRSLSCKSHKCKVICHSSDCGNCKLLPELVTSCPCGKIPILAGQRKSCTDSVPLCQAVCGKPLKCGAPSNPHQCTNKCHNGNCSTCSKETAVRCRCGHMDQMVKCRQLLTRADDARCKKRCAKKRNCGKHKCNQECCIDIDHVCPLPCNHNLSCGKHKCDQTCHKGRCDPCYRSSFDELYCECGANVIYPPVPCGTKKPQCDRPCSRSHPCDHPVQHNCHSAALCPPCMAFTTKFCYGKHEQRKTIPCSQGEFGCGLPCGRPLRCGQHRCQRPCHGSICEKDDDLCKQGCIKLRTLCGHACRAACHAGECPETVCRENVELTCVCGNRKQMRLCHELQRDAQRMAKVKLALASCQDMDNRSIDLNDVLCPGKLDNNRTIECNDECKMLERNRRIDAAFRMGDSSDSATATSLSTMATSSSSLRILTKYSDFIKSWAKKDPTLVGMIHEKLTELVKLAKEENKQRSRSHSFPRMNREKRQLVHEMCEMFGVESVAYDAEPNRNVVATATKDSCWFPCISIFEALQRESGQRRIPVPNNNAWGAPLKR